MPRVSAHDVRQVALLASLRLPDQELTRFAAQLDEILGYVQQLQAIPTAGIEPTSHVLPLSNVMRPDATVPSPSSETALRLAPARHGPLVQVPKVVETQNS